MRYIAEEAGKTIRLALASWPLTARLCVVMAVLGILVATLERL